MTINTGSVIWHYMLSITLYTGIVIALLYTACYFLKKHIPNFDQAPSQMPSQMTRQITSQASGGFFGKGSKKRATQPAGFMNTLMTVFQTTPQPVAAEGMTQALKQESVLFLEPRKSLHVVAVGQERFLVSSVMDRVELLSKLADAPETPLNEASLIEDEYADEAVFEDSFLEEEMGLLEDEAMALQAFNEPNQESVQADILALQNVLAAVKTEAIVGVDETPAVPDMEMNVLEAFEEIDADVVAANAVFEVAENRYAAHTKTQQVIQGFLATETAWTLKDLMTAMEERGEQNYVSLFSESFATALDEPVWEDAFAAEQPEQSEIVLEKPNLGAISLFSNSIVNGLVSAMQATITTPKRQPVLTQASLSPRQTSHKIAHQAMSVPSNPLKHSEESDVTASLESDWLDGLFTRQRPIKDEKLDAPAYTRFPMVNAVLNRLLTWAWNWQVDQQADTPEPLIPIRREGSLSAKRAPVSGKLPVAAKRSLPTLAPQQSQLKLQPSLSVPKNTMPKNAASKNIVPKNIVLSRQQQEKVEV